MNTDNYFRFTTVQDEQYLLNILICSKAVHYTDKNLNLTTNWQFTKYGIVSENEANLVNVECGI